MTVHSRPFQYQLGIEDSIGRDIVWYELIAEVRRRWPQATSKYTDAELVGELRDPQTLKIALGLEPAAPSSSFLYVPEGGYAPPRSITRFSPPRSR